MSRAVSMADEGKLSLVLVNDGGRVSRVELTSTRRTDFSRILTGLPVEKALALVPALYSICATAQAVAGLEACEAALGLEVDEGNRALRAAMVALEAIDNHAFQFFVEWPRVVGRPPEAAAYRQLKAATQVVRGALLGRAVWAKPCGVAVEPVALAEAVGVLRAAVEGLIPPVGETTDEALCGWSPFLRAALAAGARVLGGGTVPLLPRLEGRWFGERLSVEPGFSARPTLNGAPAEAGCLALAGTRTVWTRLVAQLADAHRLVGEVEAALPMVGRAKAGEASGRASGVGAGVADTSRGRLAHAVTVQDGVVTSWRTVAPTEWSFHPEGAAREALLGLEEEEGRRVSPFVVAALNPCVACDVTARGGR